MSQSRSLSELAADFQQWLRDWIERNPEATARISLWAEDYMMQPDRTDAPIDLLKSFMDGLLPRNWWQLTIGRHQHAVKVMAETGVCLVWVPPGEVVDTILRAANKKERDAVLLANSELILASIAEVLDEATHPQLTTNTAAAREALDAYRAGFPGPAQSHAATILSGVVEDHYGWKLGEAASAFEQEASGEVGLWSLRRTMIQEAVRTAILNYSKRPHEPGFNRHLSVHGVSEQQFTPAHALQGLMLVAGALRELHEIYRVAERGFGPSPRLDQHARAELRRRFPALAQNAVEQDAAFTLS